MLISQPFIASSVLPPSFESLGLYRGEPENHNMLGKSSMMPVTETFLTEISRDWGY